MLSVTNQAQAKLKEVLVNQGCPDALVRILVDRGPHGCVHGWHLGIEEAMSPEDTVVQAGELRILIQGDLAPMLREAYIDYLEGPTGIGFIIHAPHVHDGHDHEHHCQH